MIALVYSQAHLQFTQADPQFKNCKRACLFAIAFLPTIKTIFFGKSSISIVRDNNCNKLIMNEAQHTTQYIKHLAESTNFKGGIFNKLCTSLIGNRFEIPNVSYTTALGASGKEAQRLIKT